MKEHDEIKSDFIALDLFSLSEIMKKEFPELSSQTRNLMALSLLMIWDTQMQVGRSITILNLLSLMVLCMLIILLLVLWGVL